MIFPFMSFYQSLRWMLWPNDSDEQMYELLQVRMMTCLEAGLELGSMRGRRGRAQN